MEVKNLAWNENLKEIRDKSNVVCNFYQSAEDDPLAMGN